VDKQMKKTLYKIVPLVLAMIVIISCAPLEEKHLIKGNKAYDKGQWDEAIAEYTLALEIDPDLLEALNNRGSAYTEKGQLDLAIADVSKVIEIDPENTLAYYNRSIAYLYKGDYERYHGNDDEARRYYENTVADCTVVINLGLVNNFILYFRGVAYSYLKDYDLALQDLYRAIEVSSEPEFVALVNQKIDSIKLQVNE
jgi:tetratricopeptide (TPR) repeat protein